MNPPPGTARSVRFSDAPTCPHGSGPKRCYRSRRDAELEAWRRLSRHGDWLRAYKCGCGAWHLSSWRQR